MVRTGWMAAVLLCAWFIALPQRLLAQATQPAASAPALAGATVAVPWPELAALLDRAGKAPAGPPVDVVFAPATYDAKPAEDVVQVTAEVELTKLREGYALVPAAAGGVAVESVTIDGQPASLVLQGRTLAVLVDGAGKKRLRVVLKRPLVREEGAARFDLPLADWPISTVQVTVPGAVQIDAANATTVTAAADGATTLTGTYRGGEVAAISWRTRLAPRIVALTQTRVAVERGVLRCQAVVSYDIRQAGADSFRISVPKTAELVTVEGDGIRDQQIVDENDARTLVVGLKEMVRKQYVLTISYDVPFTEKPQDVAVAPATQPAGAQPATVAAEKGGAGGASATASVPFIGHPDAAQARGYIGIEVRGGYELSSTPIGAERIDVKELPRALLSMARSPMQEAYRYDGGAPTLSLALTRHQDLDVLVAMSDVCEATTTIAADGRSVTKLMYIVRNNLKPHMTLRLPPGAQVWSTFVDDRPVTPVRTADGRVLIPLKRSDEVEEDDRESYQSRRDRRRKGEDDRARLMDKVERVQDRQEGVASDLKPYDVEVVYVMAAVKLADRGELELALPQSDVPVGHLAWAVFVPKHLRVIEARGNVSEVAEFTLPFRHFGDVGLAKAQQAAEMQKVAQQMQQLAQEAQAIAESSKVRGVLPVRIEIPIAGGITRLEKLLLVDEMPKTTLTYARRLD